MTSDSIAALPYIRALRPTVSPRLERISPEADVEAWHVDVDFEEWVVPEDLAERWADRDANVAETWQKRPLAAGTDSGAPYSCGEVELVARLRNAGYSAHWMSEWVGFPHVPHWQSYCIKRNEFRDRLPELWRFDEALRRGSPHATRLGRSGGHPDIVAVTSDGPVYFEYKGPGDTIRAKQALWAATLLERERDRVPYFVVRGFFRATARPPARREAVIAAGTREPDPPQRAAPAVIAPAQTREKPAARRSSSSVRKPKLDRRTISDTLKRERNWEVESHVDGSIDFFVPRRVSAEQFASEVRAAVESMGYQPTVRLATDRKGRPIVRVHTPETLEQTGRGAHGAR